MDYLVDTNVLSELTKPRPDASTVEWIRQHESELVLCSIVLGELRYGMLRLPAGRKRNELLKWYGVGIERFPSLDFDSDSAEAWATLLAKLKKAGRAMPIKDSMIAAIATQHGLTIATHNTADFQHAGLKVVDPFGG